MWDIKTFKTEKSMLKFIEKNKHKYQIDIIYIENLYGIEYKKLRVINL